MRLFLVENVTDFSSKEAMENEGWTFHWNESFVFRTAGKFCKDVPLTSYCGFGYPPIDAQLSYTFSYSGTATLEYGQSWDHGSLQVTKNDVEINSTSKRGSFNTTFSFFACDVLKIIEHDSSINIHKLTIKKSGKKKEKRIFEFNILCLFYFHHGIETFLI